ncbi:MAG: hypothetical protein A3E80_05570 [Chlamydiae bacterium RIFCSPHIGHO2_12_FULL_49_9]|nr:MAG: hypothetical protein A3E80_05570 [Chlamydiae bacterium RIFCSPHIGHO2_12_FULL_49_9]
MKLFLFLLLRIVAVGYELGIASQFRDEAPYLKEWIEYHKMVGVDHFWLYNNSSVDNWQEVLQPYIDEGLVEVFYWPSNPMNFQEFHTRANQDALRKAKGKAKWVALIDIDEFLFPTKEATVVECLEKHFQQASAIYASWRMFGTGKVCLSPGEFFLTKLVACAFRNHPCNSIGKSLVRPDRVDIDNIWYEHYMPLYPGGSGYFDGNGEDMGYDGVSLLSVDRHCDKYLRLNHYNLRDENFFKNSRIRKAEAGIYGNLKLLWEHYESFSLIRDLAMVNFLKNKHPDMYEKFWKNP